MIYRNNYANLVRETLKEIPKQFIEYMEMNKILPINYEQKNQKKLKFNDLDKDKGEDDDDKEDNKFFSYLKEKFIKDWMSLGFEKSAIVELANKGVMSLDINFAFEFLTTQQKIKNKKKKESPEKSKKSTNPDRSQNDSPDRFSRTQKTIGGDKTEKSKSAIDEAERVTVPEEKSKEEQVKVYLIVLF